LKKRYWWVILTYIIMQFSVPILVLTLGITHEPTIIYLSVLSFILGLIIVLWLMKPDMKVHHVRSSQRSKQIVTWSIIGFFLAYFAQLISVVIESSLFGIAPGSENTQFIMEITRTMPIFMIIPAIVAPILEEVIFRNIIFGTLYTRSNFWIAAILSSFIFGLIHQEFEHILIYTSMGFVFAFLYVKTKSILTPIIVHIGLNSFSIIMQYSLDPEDFERMRQQWENIQTILIVLIGG